MLSPAAASPVWSPAPVTASLRDRLQQRPPSLCAARGAEGTSRTGRGQWDPETSESLLAKPRAAGFQPPPPKDLILDAKGIGRGRVSVLLDSLFSPPGRGRGEAAGGGRDRAFLSPELNLSFVFPPPPREGSLTLGSGRLADLLGRRKSKQERQMRL